MSDAIAILTDVMLCRDRRCQRRDRCYRYLANTKHFTRRLPMWARKTPFGCPDFIELDWRPVIELRAADELAIVYENAMQEVPKPRVRIFDCGP